jgi:tryptophan halogenase
LRVLIVGGGSAGWIAAATLANRLNGRGPRRVSISLVESPETPRIGVGEATIPTIRDMLRRFGIDEPTFMRGCEASFKHAIRFDDWSAPGSRYLHPFHRDLGAGSRDAAVRWLASDARTPFADLASSQGPLIAAGKGPRCLDAAEYVGEVPYAYHMDAEMFADMLARQCAARGVAHLSGHVEDVERTEDGLVSGLRLRDGREVAADLYVDCTGFRALLSPQANAATGWVDQSNHLLCDRAVTLRVPEDPERFTPAPFTRARALECGWCWDIGLRTRRGRGYVYSSAHASPQEAEAALRAEEGAAAEGLAARHIAFRVGRQVAPWTGNVVAVGLAAGFLEPLESTGIYLADYAARVLGEMFPPSPAAATGDALARRYNQLMAETHDDILDFITLHYTLAGRRNTPFWRHASAPERCSERLHHLLALWQLRPPSFADFSLRYPPFNHLNYEFILFGSGWRPESAPRGVGTAAPDADLARRTSRLISALPDNAQALRALHG